MGNSYVVDDGLAVSAYTDTVNQSDAKAEVCKAVLVEMLLRAPRRGCVRLLQKPLQRIPEGVQVIWDLVHQLQLEMHGYAMVQLRTEEDAGINAAPSAPAPQQQATVA